MVRQGVDKDFTHYRDLVFTLSQNYKRSIFLHLSGLLLSQFWPKHTFCETKEEFWFMYLKEHLKNIGIGIGCLETREHQDLTGTDIEKVEDTCAQLTPNKNLMTDPPQKTGKRGTEGED